jgi:hypothetical protein
MMLLLVEQRRISDREYDLSGGCGGGGSVWLPEAKFLASE